MDRTPEQLEEIRQKAMKDKIERLESLGVTVTKHDENGVTFYCKDRWSHWLFRREEAVPLHLGTHEWNLMDHLIFRLRDLLGEQRQKDIAAAVLRRPKTNPRFDIKNLPTKTLLEYLRRARACGGMYDPWYCGGGGPFHPIYTEELKAELATRPHVPNKIEAKAIRRNKLKQKKDRGGVRR